MRKKITGIVFFLVAALSFCACSNEDDIGEIFTGHDWTLAFIQEGNDKSTPKDGDYTIVFNSSTFTLTTPANATITGNWQADGESRSFRCSNIRTTENINSDNTANKMKQLLQNATSYAGDANWLQIIVQTGNVFMQFHNK